MGTNLKRRTEQHRSPGLLVFLLCVLAACEVEAGFLPDSLYGPYNVIHSSHTLYDSSTSYSYRDYSGAAPIFVHVWQGVDYQVHGRDLLFGELSSGDEESGATQVLEALNRYSDSCMVRYYLSEDILNWEKLKFEGATENEVIRLLKDLPTNATAFVDSRSSDQPVILYHHGLQGLAQENFAMAEFFASHGFTFVSANFHLPYEGELFGMVEASANNLSRLKVVADYAASLTLSGELFYIGHSWGAQVGWCHLHKLDNVKAFVSMETTIEFKSDSTKVKEMWPDVYEVLTDPTSQPQMPILLFANTMAEGPFRFFYPGYDHPRWYVGAKEEFMHESFTSAYLMRLSLYERYPQADEALMKRQLELYTEHLRMINDFFQSVLTEEAWIPSDPTGAFFISKYSPE